VRKNFPVTQVERPVEDGRYIVSQTDAKGRITYVNPYFIEISGFAENELLGKAHNLVRHPDMPPEAFADMWATLQGGLPWTGVVKNRCKNGDYYWVLANVTPILEGGRTLGYMSVRSKPNRHQVARADALYTALRNGSAGDVRIEAGRVLHTGWRGRLARLLHPSLKTTLALGLGGMIALLGAIAAYAGFALRAPGLVLAALAGVALAGFLWARLCLHIIGPLAAAAAVARAIAGGNLQRSFAVDRHDEVGKLMSALQQMNVNLQAIIGDVRSSASAIGDATREIADGNMDLAHRTERQAASLEETASSMEELSAAVRQNASHAEQANTCAASAAGVAREGGAVVSQVVHTMDEISGSAQRIADIIGLIDSIAFQTNILALNAAVEAARAGEQGRGFAVVAAEVRALAQRSAAAAKDIKQLIDSSLATVSSGATLVQRAGSTMDGIVASVDQVSAIMAEITVATSEQSAGIALVNRAITSLDDTTQQNAALVEHAATAAASLAEQAQGLLKTVSVFRLGQTAPAPAPAAPARPALRAA